MDRLTPARRSENMRRIRSKDTSPEMIVRRLVHGLGYRYRIHSSKLPGRPDLVFAARRKVIQVHGCFWHCHEGCTEAHIPKSRRGYWKLKLQRNKARDDENQRKLALMGWSTLTVWECEVERANLVAARVKRFLK